MMSKYFDNEPTSELGSKSKKNDSNKRLLENFTFKFKICLEKAQINVP